MLDLTRSEWGLVGTRLHQAAPRSDSVVRRALVQRLCDSAQPLISVAAPAGYGKTTLVAQWVEVDTRPTTWLSIGEDCNDPTVLLRYLAAALASVTAIDDGVFAELDAVHPRIDSVVVGGIGDAIRSVETPILAVIDDLHLLTDPHGIEALAVVTAHLAEGSQIALVGRHETGFPLAKARAGGGVLEFGVTELRFDESEAAQLVRAAGSERSDPDEVAALTEQTEGWAVGLYLAALSRSLAPEAPPAAGAFGGDDRYVADYLREEVLSSLPEEDVDFLVRTSVLDEMWGSLCDATLEVTGSGAVLERLERSNLLVVPLDRHRERYRYHHLFRDLLRMELEHRTQELVPELTDRASVWCEEHGMSDLAITYAMAGGQIDRVAQLLTRFAQQAYSGGRAESVRRWMDWLDDHASIDRYPSTAVQGGLLMTLLGRTVEAERWATAADGLDRSADRQLLGLRSVLAAMMCRHGVEEMRTDAQDALASFAAGSEWRPASMLFHAVSLLLLGDVDGAVEELRESAELGSELGTAPATCGAFTELAIVGLSRGQVDEAASWIAQALELVDQARLHGYASTALTYAVASRVALLRGDQLRARSRMDEAASLRGLLTSAFPTLALQARIHLAICAMGLGDEPAARRFLDEGDDLIRQRPALGTLVDDLASVRLDFERFRSAVAGIPSLSPAEARLLPLLTTHLTFREIGEQLFVSPHTVKTQAISIYRKLGVSSRSAAIDAARSLGLLPP